VSLTLAGGRLLSVGARGWKHQKENKKNTKQQKEQKTFFCNIPHKCIEYLSCTKIECRGKLDINWVGI
jgi:hypothetical protein